MPYSPVDCGNDELDPHYCEDGCDIVEEHARIRRGAWIHKDVVKEILADPTNPNLWLPYIASGKIIILPLLTGTFDGGTAKFVPGYGDQDQRYVGSDFKVTLEDPIYKKNYAHYRSLVGKSSWHLAYCSETQVHITSSPVSVAPKNPITNVLTDIITWQSDITWTEYFTPAPHDTPDVFDCVNPAVPPSIVQQPANQTLLVGGAIVLTVVAAGTSPLTYQWKKGGVDIVGATNASYTKTNADLTSGGAFTVVVTNAYGSVTSNTANVVVNDIVFDTILIFTTSNIDTKESVSGTAKSDPTYTDPIQQFQFNKDTSITGLPNSMTITMAGVQEMVIDFPGDYLGHLFRYVHTDGTRHLGNFANGSVSLT